MKSRVVKRSVMVGGHKTSVSLEDNFWTGLKDIVTERQITLTELIGIIDSERSHSNLSSAIRLYVLEHYRQLANAHRQDGRSAEADDRSIAAAMQAE